MPNYLLTQMIRNIAEDKIIKNIRNLFRGKKYNDTKDDSIKDIRHRRKRLL